MPTIKAPSLKDWEIGKSCIICDGFIKVSREEAMFAASFPRVCDECKQAMKELKERLKNETMA